MASFDMVAFSHAKATIVDRNVAVVAFAISGKYMVFICFTPVCKPPLEPVLDVMMECLVKNPETRKGLIPGILNTALRPPFLSFRPSIDCRAIQITTLISILQTFDNIVVAFYRRQR